ncbi:MAG: oligosaccharide flippase family protein [Saprospiraceae bacterium]|nr:oligosaccharide flippase family protein [Saprospiraceae bacterium]
MAFIKKLAGETILYGMSNILPRILNYLVITYYLTRKFPEGIYAKHGTYYAFTAFILVIFSFRMETAFFRFGNKKPQREAAFGTALLIVAAISILLSVLVFIFAHPLATMLGGDAGEYYIVQWFIAITLLDAIVAVPFARLRLEGRPLFFAGVKVLNVIINIALIFFFLELIPWLVRHGHPFWQRWVDESRLMDYVFLSNLLASAAIALFMLPYFHFRVWTFDRQLARKMLVYAAPLVIVGAASMVNLFADRLLIANWVGFDDSGIYNGAVKIAILMNLFATAFNYAAEPFFFSQSEHQDARTIYARVAQAFTLAASVLMLGILLYLDQIQVLIGRDYRAGLTIIPYSLVAYVFLGLYYNFSIWFKLKDRTTLGALIGIGGVLVTYGVNYLTLKVLHTGYIGSAYAALACFVFMALATYFTGQRNYRIPYPVGRMAAYLGGAMSVFGLSELLRGVLSGSLLIFLMNTILLGLYLTIVWLVDRKNLKALLRF